MYYRCSSPNSFNSATVNSSNVERNAKVFSSLRTHFFSGGSFQKYVAQAIILGRKRVFELPIWFCFYEKNVKTKIVVVFTDGLQLQ